MIIVNGAPKSGTHALMAWLDTMGLKRVPGTILPIHDYLYIESMPKANIEAMRSIPDNCYCLAHVPATHDLTGFRLVTIFRDPRNMLVSYCRHRLRDGYACEIPQAILDYWGTPFVALYRSYLGWHGRSIVIRYEDMPSSMIGVGRGIYATHDRDWNTFTTSPSRWQDVWDEAAEQAWIEHGGPALLSAAGYSA